MENQDSFFGEGEKYPVKGLAYGFFFIGAVASIVFILLVMDDPSILLLPSRGGTRPYWPVFLSVIFSFVITYFSLKAIIKERRKKIK